MGEKIVVGPLNKGLRKDVTAFNIDNDSFPTLINAYQWRSRVKRKRGTSLLGRLQRFISIAAPNNTNSLLMGLETNASLVPGSLNVVGSGGQTWTDLNMDGTLQGNVGGIGGVNYATGVITGPTPPNTGSFRYYPDLPVMGLEELSLIPTQFPGTLAFDTVYSYNIKTSFPYEIYDVSFYKNPAADTINLPGYVPKTAWTPTTWNGEDYQQFWTVNYQGALWGTNGIKVPFSNANIGMQYKFITGVAIITAGNGTNIPAVADLTIVAHGLVQGDFLFINEVGGITGINFQTGYVTSADPQAANTVRVTFPFAILGGAYTSGGIAQYLTNRSDTSLDSLRWYDGDPTNGNSTSPSFVQGKGWVNFAPPLSEDNYSIAGLPAAKYYLVGARMIVPFKDRLLFLGPVVQTSVAGSQIYLQDTIIYSQNGTAFYTTSYFNTPNAAVDNPTGPQNNFHPILLPVDQTATSPSYFEDQTGFGGFVRAGISQPIVTSSSNEDVLIVGFSNTQTRLVYSGNDIVPFNFFLINSELGSGSTFSVINMDKGVLTRGQRGYVATSQVETSRIDLDIPDEVFEIGLVKNGNERFTAQRDFINEWCYFTYPVNNSQDKYKFPNQTLQFNYRDNSWAIFNETYTTYGSFRKSSGFTWGTVGTVYPSWGVWNVPWNAGSSTLEQPEVIAGNQQGFIVFRDDGTEESNSLYIQNFSSSLVTSPNHTLNEGDYIIISGVLGTIGTQVNGKIFSVESPITANTFTLNPAITAGTYLGGGLIKRMYVPFIQTKQFPVAWEMARKTRLGPQQYLFTTTPDAQIQLLIYLSQNSTFSYSDGPIVPSINTENNSLVYSSIIYTCPESTNLGLLPPNVNLNLVTSKAQAQTWHRMNTSLLGDTIQIGFTMSDEQMRSLIVNGPAIAITDISQSSPGVLTTTGNFPVGQLIEINGVVGMTELNQNRYIVLSSTPTTTTIDVNTTSFSEYISGGTGNEVSPKNQFAEIELHGFILDVNPSQLLA